MVYTYIVHAVVRDIVTINANLNMFQVRRPMEQSYWVESISNSDSDGDADFPVCNKAPEGEATVGERLTSAQQKELKKLLSQFAVVMKNKPGRTTITEHHIETGLANPVRLPPYRLPHAFRETVQEMMETGIIENPCQEERRFPEDVCGLSTSLVDAYPMPRINDLINRLGTAKYITTLDLPRGYWQMPVAEKDKDKTGLFQFNIMPFGLIFPKNDHHTRTEGESVSAYIAALRDIAQHCDYKDSLQDMLRGKLVHRVRHERITNRLLAEKTSHEKALELALAVESAERDTKQLQATRYGYTPSVPQRARSRWTGPTDDRLG